MDLVSNYKCINGDLLEQYVDAIVIPANYKPKACGALDKLVYKLAGEEDMINERKKIGKIDVGKCAITPGFKLRQKIIHAVTPSYITKDSDVLLRMCYDNALKLAHSKGIKTIAFPLLGAGNMGFPYKEACEIAELALNSVYARQNFYKIFLVEKEESIAQKALKKDYYDYYEGLLADMDAVADHENKEQAEYIHALYTQMRKDKEQWEKHQKEREKYKKQLELEKLCKTTDEFNGTILKQMLTKYKDKYRSIDMLSQDSEVPNLDKMVRGERSINHEHAIKLALQLELEPIEFREFVQLVTGTMFPKDLFDRVVIECIMMNNYNYYYIEAEYNKTIDIKKNKSKQSHSY